MRAAAVAVALASAAQGVRAEERIRVRLEGSRKIEDLRLEDYVAGVVAGEMPSSFPPEALKAQAVAARSYALTRKLEAQRTGKPWDISAGVLTQVYQGRHSPAARAAADATLGEVLVMGMEPVEAYFHSVCCGQTESGLAALGRDLPYLTPVDCGGCDDVPGAHWRREFSAAELGRVAGLGGAAEAVRVVSRTQTGRAERVEISRGDRSAMLAAAAQAARAEERIRVRLEGSDQVRDLRLEDYVAGVVAGEMPPSFPVEALKAQAVAARSYALTRKLEAQRTGKPWDISAGVLNQVYQGQHIPAARGAADATVGEVLVMGLEPVEAYFHSVCCGTTESGLAALGRDLPYLVPVDCGACDDVPGARWRREFSAAELGRLAGLGGPADRVEVASRTGTGRAERVEVLRGGRSASLAAADLRQRLGFSRLPSLAFEVAPARGGFVFEGTGRGHGAGMSQHGAAGMARQGKTYREILAHYYPGTEVIKMY